MPVGAKQVMSDQENPQPETESTSPGRSERTHRDRGRRRHRQMPRNLEASINMEELRELIGLITDNALTDFELEREGFHVKVGRNPYPRSAEQPVLPPVSEPHAIPAAAGSSAVSGVPTTSPRHPGAHAEEEASEDLGLHIVNSPIVGTFYRSPSPTADPFVRINSQVKKGQVICIIEAMKLMNDIESDIDGEVVKIYVENGQPVEFGQPLFGIKAQ